MYIARYFANPEPGNEEVRTLIHYKNVRVISTLPGLAQLHLFSDLQHYIIIIITPPETEAYIIILKIHSHVHTL